MHSRIFPQSVLKTMNNEIHLLLYTNPGVSFEMLQILKESLEKILCLNKRNKKMLMKVESAINTS